MGLKEDFEKYLATVAEMLTAEGMAAAADPIREADARLEETGYDRWNGGTTVWTIWLQLPAARYARLSTKRKVLEDQINERLKDVLQQFATDWITVSIVPQVEAKPEWRDTSKGISEETRRNIFDGLKIDNVPFSGRLDDVEFLSRVFDLKTMPSHDSRFDDAAGDIWQHRYNNQDWGDDWIFEDSRFNLLKGSSEKFLRFLCEMVHPVVRPDRDVALGLVSQFNDQLRREGWHLVEQEKIAGRPRFVAEQVRNRQGRSVSRARSVAEALDAGWMQTQIERLERAIEHDPTLAIGTAKELVETCCKSILTKRGIPFTRGADMQDLTKAVVKELKLIPEDIPERARGSEAIRLILRNLASLSHYLAELRGLYGTGHGQDGKYRGLEPRHARLAVGAAVSFIDFVTETHQQRTKTDGSA